MQSNNIFETWLSNEKLPYLLANQVKFTVIETGEHNSKISIAINGGWDLNNLIYAGVAYGMDAMSNSYHNLKTA